MIAHSRIWLFGPAILVSLLAGCGGTPERATVREVVVEQTQPALEKPLPKQDLDAESVYTRASAG